MKLIKMTIKFSIVNRGGQDGIERIRIRGLRYVRCFNIIQMCLSIKQCLRVGVTLVHKTGYRF